MRQPLLSIIIVQYNIYDLLCNCLESIYASKVQFDYEIIIVDNNFIQEEVNVLNKKFPHLKIINPEYNAGFSRANNLGIRNSRGEYIMLLNPDAQIGENFLENFLLFYKKHNQSNKLGLLTCRIVSVNGEELQVGSWKSYPSLNKFWKQNPLVIILCRYFPHLLQNKYDPNIMHYKDHEIGVASGACILIKKDRIELHNLEMDEDFFLYSEDVEWSYRVAKYGYFNYFCATEQIKHVNSASTGQSQKRLIQMQASEILYFFKCRSRFVFWFLKLLMTVNFYSNYFLLSKNNQLNELQQLKSDWKFLKDIFVRINQEFEKKPSSGRNYLRV